ncbi:hypothetical protein bcere0020_56720 [Bacillus cereus Rock3-29]|nr:hypothetical protein bcere0020_56720 [Bacillus cereus Rock3-29]
MQNNNIFINGAIIEYGTKLRTLIKAVGHIIIRKNQTTILMAKACHLVIEKEPIVIPSNKNKKINKTEKIYVATTQNISKLLPFTKPIIILTPKLIEKIAVCPINWPIVLPITYEVLFKGYVHKSLHFPFSTSPAIENAPIINISKGTIYKIRFTIVPVTLV